MRSSEDTGLRFRELMSRPQGVFGFGVRDAFDAAVAEMAGAECIYAGGYSIALSRMRPDMGQMNMVEVRDAVMDIARAVALPVIADIDDGYGNALNVHRTMEEFLGREVYDPRSGFLRRIAGVHIEDQVFPKRCGHIAGKEVVPRDVMVKKIELACRLRDRIHPNAVIIARTDAYNGKCPETLEETVDRMCAYAEAGADLCWPELNTTDREVALTIAEEVRKRWDADYPLAFNYSPSLPWHEDADPLTFEELASAGYKFIFVTIAAAHAASYKVFRYAKRFKKRGAKALWDMQIKKGGHPTESHHEMARVPMWQEILRRHSPDEKEREEKGEGFTR